jgi:hypothetical protein
LQQISKLITVESGENKTDANLSITNPAISIQDLRALFKPKAAPKKPEQVRTGSLLHL